MQSDSEPIGPQDLEALFGRCGIGASTQCALAVSGGSDSTALMVLFADWLRQSGKSADLHTVLALDHGLRPESAGEARAVTAGAAALGFRHATLVWKGTKPRTGIQAAARAARYGLIADYMRAKGIAVLFTGHTRDDQAETLLMRLARGSGLDGLAGMAPRLRFSDLGLGDAAQGEPEIVRPLLDVPKARLRATLEMRGMAWIEDPSNQSPDFERSRLRTARVLLDSLGLTDAMLALSAARLRRARQALDHAVDDFCSPANDAVGVDPCGYFTIDRARLRAAPPEIALRALGRVIAAAGGSDEPVPLGKLETIADALQSSDVATVKWTLARAMITTNGHAVAVEREPGREALPVVVLMPGARMRWDGRFWIEVGAGATDAVELRPLGEAAARELLQQGAVATHVPTRAIGMVPSFWREGSLIAVPPLRFCSVPECRDAFQARFVWIETAKGRRSGGPESPE